MSDKKYVGGKKLQPKRHKASGRPFVRLKYEDENGKITYPTRYLDGEFESREMYRSLQELKDELFGVKPTEPAEKKFDAKVKHVFKAFWDRKCEVRDYDPALRPRYDETKRDYFGFLANVGKILKPHASRSAADYKMKDLQELRDIEVEMTTNTRKHINKQFLKIKEMFRYAAQIDLIPAETAHHLQMFKNLTSEDTNVKGPGKIHVPHDWEVEAVLNAACPFMRTAIIVTAGTGMRAQNLEAMRWEDIDMSEEEENGVWIYTPQRHKTQEHMHLDITMGPQVITALKNFRDMAPIADSGRVFSAKVLTAWRNLQDDKEEVFQQDVSTVAEALADGITTSKELAELVPTGLPNILRALTRLGWVIEKQVIRKRLSHVCSEGHTWHREAQFRQYEVTTLGEMPNYKARTWHRCYEDLGGKHHVTDKFSRHAFLKALEQIIIEINTHGGATYYDKKKKKEVTKKVSKITPHRFRNYYTKVLVQEHGFKAAGAVIGHISEQMTKQYSGFKQDIKLAIETQAKH